MIFTRALTQGTGGPGSAILKSFVTASARSRSSAIRSTPRLRVSNRTKHRYYYTRTMETLTKDLAAVGFNDKLTEFPGGDPTINPIDIYRSYIADQVAKITGAAPEVVYPAIQWTKDLDKGDLTLTVAALRLKLQGKGAADQLAADIASKFPETPLLQKPTSNGPYLQFWFSQTSLPQLILPLVLKSKDKYGFSDVSGLKDPKDPSKGKKKIIVEFSSPNIAKPFHAGHLRSTIIGGFLANLYERSGWDTLRFNYLGDWGRQFGLLAVAFEKFGSEEELQKNPIGHLYDIYVEINRQSKPEEDEIAAKKAAGEEFSELEAKSLNGQARAYFKRMEDGDEKALAVWRRFRDLSIQRYKETYARLNIRFDVYDGESLVPAESMKAAAQVLADKGISEESDGAILCDLTKYNKKLEKVVVQKKDGTTLYITRDISAIKERFEKYHYDKMIYVVASQQDLHFKQLFKIVELMDRKDIADRCVHINFGMVLGMSTRKGTVKFLDDILRDVGEKMHEVMRTNDAKYQQVEDPEKTADTLGITSVMVQDMSGKRINNYEFNIDRMTSFEGDTGPYLQYAHARICSITRKANISAEELLNADLSLLTEPHAVNLLRVLAQWPDVVSQTLKTLEPTTVIVYLFKMTHMLSSSYDSLRIVGSEAKLATARMALYESARQVLRNGMTLLGLSPVERM